MGWVKWWYRGIEFHNVAWLTAQSITVYLPLGKRSFTVGTLVLCRVNLRC